VQDEHGVTYKQEDIGRFIRIIGALGDELASSVEDLLQRTTALEFENERLRTSLGQLEDRFADLLSERTVGRSDLHGGAHLTHINLAADYRSLVMQWMQRVARKLIKGRSRQTLEYDLGQQVAVFTEFLFRGDFPDSTGLLSSLHPVDGEILRLAESMCARATELRHKITDVGIHHEWDFRSELSGILKDERQEAWLTSDPSKPVILVVAPAYLVQGVVYAKQLVFTGESRP
jgi:hypothetical protein